MKITVLFRHRRWATLAALPILACAPMACSGNSASEGQGNEAHSSLGNVEVVSIDKLSSTPTYVKGNLGLADSKGALDSIASVFHANAPNLALANTLRDNSGAIHDRYTQFKNGREILGGELVVHSRNGVIYAANGNAVGFAARASWHT